ncbi:MAG: PilZ domain-containing protein [Myxococcaceae bacterium]
MTAPIRLKVSYKSAESLVNEFTKSVGKGGVALESRKKVPIGTQFVFELVEATSGERVEVVGEVVSVTQVNAGKFLLNIRYDAGLNRGGLDAVLQRIYDTQQLEKMRKHPRVPINMRATEDAAYSTSYLIRDVSGGGAGVEIESPKVRPEIVVSGPVLLEIWLSLGTLALHGEIMWVSTPPADRAKWINPSFGVRFGKLRTESAENLEKLLQLKGLPPPPWKARVSFGMDAVSRMP